MNNLRFRSDTIAEYVEHCGGDQRVAHAAWVLRPGQEDPRDNVEGWRRVIRSMLCANPPHTSPFEHGDLGIYIEAPAFVWWQLTRHRFMSQEVDDFSLSLESGRYKILEGQFYEPPSERPLLEPSGFKPMRPILASSDNEHHEEVRTTLRHVYEKCWEGYERGLLAGGVAREVARNVLPFGIYYAGHVSAKPWTWLHFFSLRLKAAGGFPQWEIARLAGQCGEIFARHWPITWELFCEKQGIGK